jgi:iron-sulfur cluster assembly protein
MKVDIDFKLTESAINEIKSTIEQEKIPTENLLRISVKSGGCSGFSYGLNFVEATDVVENKDVVEELNGIKIVIDKSSLLYLDGTTLDWVDDNGQKGFKLNTPQPQSKSCGCKKSGCRKE